MPVHTDLTAPSDRMVIATYSASSGTITSKGYHYITKIGGDGQTNDRPAARSHASEIVKQLRSDHKTVLTSIGDLHTDESRLARFKAVISQKARESCSDYMCTDIRIVSDTEEGEFLGGDNATHLLWAYLTDDNGNDHASTVRLPPKADTLSQSLDPDY